VSSAQLIVFGCCTAGKAEQNYAAPSDGFMTMRETPGTRSRHDSAVALMLPAPAAPLPGVTGKAMGNGALCIPWSPGHRSRQGRAFSGEVDAVSPQKMRPLKEK